MPQSSSRLCHISNNTFYIQDVNSDQASCCYFANASIDVEPSHKLLVGYDKCSQLQHTKQDTTMDSAGYILSQKCCMWCCKVTPKGSLLQQSSDVIYLNRSLGKLSLMAISYILDGAFKTTSGELLHNCLLRLVKVLCGPFPYHLTLQVTSAMSMQDRSA